ncbi:flagellar type III secretion system pore protein FliP [Parvularcula sp. ZS-1/3]|uniref:Flagellar biosynthetic protein FliP n=1 Tax=Parvularcula mediterranea TaxID=2732508 RepID=A0A7Y3W6M5_9PROT|nr:flagellar type III secretion system pore protein FliP [Parvularcula mediterranea]NNU17436.1 flagellar type III secretion system pore protein FliP [Parvularcula mediterranea]
MTRLAINAAIIVGLFLALMIAPEANAQAVTLDIGDDGASYTGRLIQLFLAVTVLTLAPGILVMTTSFIRIVVVFSLLRSAMGLQQAPPNVVLISLALFLTGFIMAPTFQESWNNGIAPMIEDQIDTGSGIRQATLPLQRFMAAQTEPDDLEFFLSLAERQQADIPEDDLPATMMSEAEIEQLLYPDRVADPDLPPMTTLIPAFMISELTRAFEIGFLLMMPFLVIDLAVAAILMSMGMMMLPPQTVSLSMKIIFFVLIDGWRLLSESLVMSFF